MPLNDKIIKSDDVAKITAALIELGTIAYRADRTPVDQTEESINAQVDVIASALSLSESFPNPATRHTREQVLNMATNVRDNAWPADVKEYMVLIEPMLRAYADSLALEPVRTTPPRMPAMSERLTDSPKTQSDEFDAVAKLSNAYRKLTMTPIVDDDYPEVRHRYELALREMSDAMKANGRFQRGVLS